MGNPLCAADLLHHAANDNVSDIFITCGCPIMIKRNGAISTLNFDRIAPDGAAQLVRDLFALAPAQNYDAFLAAGDCEFSMSIAGVGRFRVCAFCQRGSVAAVIHVMRTHLPKPDSLGIPRAVLDLCRKTGGLILVTGPAGSGTTTTLAVMIDQINAQRSCHIITLESPVEYLHTHKMGLVNQREIGTDTASYTTALQAALHQSPDVIMIGALRDLPTISAALSTAEAGVLVLATLPTIGAAASIDRMIDAFPPAQQPQIRVQLATTLQAVVSQRLLPSRKQGCVAVFEVMTATATVRNMIRTAKTHQLDTAILGGAQHGMLLMDYAIAAALKRGDISHSTAITCCTRPELIDRLV